MFPRINDREITAEKTPQYFDDLPQNLPQIIHKSLPRAKLFLVVCDPAKRSFSDYVQEVSTVAFVMQQEMSARVPHTFDMSMVNKQSKTTQSYFFYLVAYLSYHEKAISALYELA